MRIKQISVQNLFGMFNHVVNLNLEERMTIIHGPNGYGKTVLLRMIDGLSKGNYSIFRTVPFDTFRMEFDNNRFIVVRQTQPRGQNERARISIHSGPSDEKPFTPDLTEPKQLSFPLSAIEEVVPDIRRIGADEWLEQRTGQILSLEDIFDKYRAILPFKFEHRQTPKWLKELQGDINTHFVQTNRLFSQQTVNRRVPRVYEREIVSSYTSSVTQYSKELAEKIQNTLAIYAELSQSLDRTFPKRLVDRMSSGRRRKIAIEKLRNELRDLEEKRAKLMAAGLMDKSDIDVQIPEGIEVGEPARVVLSIYSKDVGDKLKVYDEMLAKISLLQSIINSRYSYSFKRLRVDKTKGFVIETQAGTTLFAEALSSGEQHELVMFYELLFRVQPGSFILIDEPELSLHIAWQQEFLKDLTEIASLSNVDVLIATHSADIIYDKWNLTVELQGPQA